MKKEEVIIGQEYLCRLQSGQRRVCRIDKKSTTQRGFYATNMRTGRAIYLKSPMRILFLVERTGEIGKWRRAGQAKEASA